MSNPSNLYAEKIYAEHPMAFWALDDQADYVSLIDDLERDITNSEYWYDPVNGSVTQYLLDISAPFPESPVTKVTGNSTGDQFGQVVCISKDIINFNLLNKDLSTFSIGAFIHSLSVYVSSFEIGYEYYDTVSGSTIQRLKKYFSSVSDRWVFISETFDAPEEVAEFRVVIKINYIDQGNSLNGYDFLINGVSVGQWSEEFNTSSLGISQEPLPYEIEMETTYGVKATAYGRQDKKGYYLISDNSLVAKNTGIPLVYGASNLTKLLPNNNAAGMTYTIYKSGDAYHFEGIENNPIITVTRGSDYRFNLDAEGNGFCIQTTDGEYNSANEYLNGVNNNGADIGDINWTVPEDAPETLYYVSKTNKKMSGKIKVEDVKSKPSLIIPAQGFLGEDGKYKEYTLEAWLRINSDSITKKRIVGPIGSDDGLYVEGPFLILKIGNNFGSYYVGEWYRPMLIHIRVSENNSSLVINGEEVISLKYLTEELTFPTSLNEDNRNQDWIGFYSYEDVSPIDLDCVALYTYQVPLILAKKRFVYGQAVEFPEGINKAYSGSSIYIDYPFAKYTNNYSYPNIGSWSQGVIDNLKTESNLLSTPDYKLPTITLGSNSLENLYNTLSAQQNEDELFFSFDGDEGSHLYFENLNFLKESVKSFYGSFKFTSVPTGKQVLFKAESRTSTNYFEISCNGTSVSYSLNYNGISQTLLTLSSLDIGEMFSVGIDPQTLSHYFGGNVASFFGNINSLGFYIGGSSNSTETFSGKIYKIGFCTARNHKSIKEFFNEKGIVIENDSVFVEYIQTPDVEYNSTQDYFGNNSAEWDEIVDAGMITEASANTLQSHTASYTLSPTQIFGSYYLDIDIQGYWEDYLPLTHFAKYITDNKSKPYYDLDFIQFNINYPAPSVFIEEEQFGSWTYKELSETYNVPVQRDYSSLDNQLFTGYLDYTDLRDRTYRNYKYDTSNSLVKSYITFQYIKNGANLSVENFANTAKPSNDSSVIPGDEWRTTKYEVVDNMIIYTPKDVSNLDLAIVTHLEFNVKGILKNKVALRTLEYCSQAFNNTSPNAVGTRFGHSLYPYKKSGFYYDYKTENPFSIYKGTSPYLYLTRYTGVELKGTMDPTVNRGLSVSINKDKSDNFKVMALQMAVRYDKDAFPYGTIEVFEIKSKYKHIKFYMSAVHPAGHRAKIYAIDVNTGKLENGIKFYLNGKIVKDPVITVKEWAFLGISFAKSLDFTNRMGLLNLNGPLMFNTISYYESSNLQEIEEKEYRRWFGVKYVLPENIEASPEKNHWDYWITQDFLWDGVLYIAKRDYYGVDPSTIYKSYTGTSKVIVDSDSILYIYNQRTDLEYEYRIYSGINSKLITTTAI
jgi:hypothetical protein